MLRNWKRLSIKAQFMTLMFVILSIMLCAFYGAIHDNNIQSKLQEAIGLADQNDNFGAWVAQYGGIYVRTDGEADLMARDSVGHETFTVEDTRKITFLHKNPALAQRELSQITEKSNSKGKFRMVSDNPMNPDNIPNRFEMSALEKIRENGIKDYFEIKNGKLLYARGIIAKAACLKCHESPEKAPTSVRDKYPSLGKANGYGYVVGQIIGVTSVSVPLDSPLEMISHLSPNSWLWFGALILAIMLMFVIIIQFYVKPLKYLKNFTDKVVRGDEDLESPSFDSEQETSQNEIHQLCQGFGELNESYRIALKENNNHSRTQY